MCAACGPAIRFRVTDARTGDAIDGVTIDGSDGWECSSTGVTCQDVPRPGTYDLEVGAPGYEPRTVTVVVPRDDGEGCCSCGFREVEADVELQPSAA